MSQDILSDGLNIIRNAKKAGKTSVEIKYHSKLLLSVLAIAKLRGYVRDYKVHGTVLKVELGSLIDCCSIKPRYLVSVNEIEKYLSRYLPAKHLGIIIISTSQGLMTHSTAIEKNIGGALLAYFF